MEGGDGVPHFLTDLTKRIEKEPLEKWSARDLAERISRVIHTMCSKTHESLTSDSGLEREVLEKANLNSRMAFFPTK